MRKMTNKKGFTLMEMLIVVAIIAILVAIAIPTVTTALENSREATDAANIRAAYAEVMVKAMTSETTDVDNGAYTIKYDDSAKTYTATITLTQKKDGWQNSSITNIAGEKIVTSGSSALNSVKSGEKVTIVYKEADNSVTFTATGNT